MKPLILLIVSAFLANAQETPKVFRASQVFFVASQAADLASCGYGCPEANSLLASGGQMRAKGIAIKVGFTLGILALQRYTPKRWRKGWTVFNTVVGVSHTRAAVQNWRIN